LGTFALYYRSPCEPDEDDEAVIEILTRTAALAIEHSRAESELADSEEKFRSLSRCAPVGVFMLDPTGAFSYVNPRFIEITGFEYEKTFEYWFEVATGDTAEASAWRRAVESRSEHTGEFTIRKDGVERPVSLRMAPMRSRSGEYLGYVGTLEDVSARVAGATALDREQSLRRAIEESIPAGIAVVDLDGTQTYVNRAFAEMVGWPAEELIGAKAPFVYWPSEDRAAIEGALASTIAGRASTDGYELRFRRRNGETFDALVSVAPVAGKRGEVSGCVTAVTDLNRCKRGSHKAQAK
jgi:PAS domain S-box-containing protein